MGFMTSLLKNVNFNQVNQVLILLPTAKFLAFWQRPGTVIKNIIPVSYKVHQPGCQWVEKKKFT